MSDGGAAAIVVGGGLAGCELAWGLAGAAVPTLLVTTSLDTIANLPGDRWRFEPPAGGLLERVAAEARGDDGAWRSWPLHRAAKRELERLPELHVLQSTVTGLLLEGGRVAGVTTWEGVDRRAGRAALCVGTFLRARLEQGALSERAGRLSELAYDDLYDDLVRRGVRLVDAEVRLRGEGSSPGDGRSPGDETSPGYVVRHAVVASEELSPGGELRRLPGAWALGGCAGGGVDLATAAAQGSATAESWLRDLRV